MKLTYLLDCGYLSFDITISTDQTALPVGPQGVAENMQRFNDYIRVINEAIGKEADSERQTSAEIIGERRRDRALKLLVLERTDNDA